MEKSDQNKKPNRVQASKCLVFTECLVSSTWADQTVVNDPSIIKQITVKDFDSFVNHDNLLDESVDKLGGKNLIQLLDERWRTMRNSLSPIFTSAKMKMMFGILTDCAQEFIEHFDEKPSDKIIVDVKDMFSRYTVNGISTAALGFQGDCIKNENSYIYKMAHELAHPKITIVLKVLLAMTCKPLYRLFRFQLVSQKHRNFFERTIIDVMNERDANGTFRPDIVQLMLQMRKGTLKREENDDKDEANFAANIEYDVGGNNTKIKWDKEDFMAQGAVFFGAGYETTQHLLQVTAYELAKNRDVQDELIAEVDEVLSAMNGKPVTYEALNKMKFLDQVISEVLRFQPPVPFTNRECNNDYRIDLKNGRSVLVKAGEQVIFPIWSIHRDERNYANAGKFDPYRFDDDKKDLIVPGSYIPFGEFLEYLL
jgi:cytochrome P450 family 9